MCRWREATRYVYRVEASIVVKSKKKIAAWVLLFNYVQFTTKHRVRLKFNRMCYLGTAAVAATNLISLFVLCDKNINVIENINKHVIISNDDAANSINLFLNEPCYHFICRFYSLTSNFLLYSIQFNSIVSLCVIVALKMCSLVPHILSVIFELNKMLLLLKHMC